MKVNLDSISTIILDCDGVVFDSNKSKSEAFRRALRENGIEQKHIDEFIEYHITYGGISRYVKLEYLIREILNQDFDKKFYEILLKSYARHSAEAYLEVPFTVGCLAFLAYAKKQSIDLFIASGSDEAELREVFEKRGIKHYFKEVYGSPKTKNNIVGFITAKLKKEEVMMVGDAVSDLNAAHLAKIVGYGMTGYSESKESLLQKAKEYDYECLTTLKELTIT